MMWFYDLRNIYTLKCFTVLNITKDIPSSTLLAKKNQKTKNKKKTPGSLAGLHYLYLFGDTVIFLFFFLSFLQSIIFFLTTCQLKNKALSCPMLPGVIVFLHCFFLESNFFLVCYNVHLIILSFSLSSF